MLLQYEALRRVHLIPAGDVSEEAGMVNSNVFRDLDSPVSEGGENFSTGYVNASDSGLCAHPNYSEKQLLCMARAILKRTKLLMMDEATARFVVRLSASSETIC